MRIIYYLQLYHVAVKNDLLTHSAVPIIARLVL